MKTFEWISMESPLVDASDASENRGFNATKSSFAADGV